MVIRKHFAKNCCLMNKKYKFALFDWDGCLGNSLSLAYQNYEEIARQNGIKLTEADFRAIVGKWKESTLFCGYNDIDKFKKAYNKLNKEGIYKVVLNPNVLQMLLTLKEKGVVMAILSSSSKLAVEKMVENNRISKYFNNIIGYEDVVKTKPHPEAVYKLLDLFNAPKKDCILIGDTENDIIAANNTGIDSVWYALQSNRRFYGDIDFKGHEPTYKINDFNQLTDYF